MLLLAVVYWSLIPSVMARFYLSGLEDELATAKSALNKVAGSSGLPMFVDPDTSLGDRQKQIGQSLEHVQSARLALRGLESASRLSSLPGGASLGGEYRTAQVVQSRVKNMRLQSEQILGQYSGLLRYLQAYTILQSRLNSRLDEVNRIQDFDGLAGDGDSFLASAQTIRSDIKTLGTLKPPPDFAELHKEASLTFRQAAEGFSQLETGLELFSDFRTYDATTNLEATTLKSQLADNSLLVGLAAKSPTLRQLAELPEKLENAQVRSPEK